MPHMKLKWKVMMPIIVVGLITSVAINRYMVYQSTEQISQSSIDSAKAVSGQVRQMRGYYTKNIVKKALKNGIGVKFEHADSPSAIPLPATMVHDINKAVSESEGYAVRLYSDHPFPFRKDGGARDEFEQEALDYLKANPEETFSRLDRYNGVLSMRYASADRMVSQVCVNCHNSRPDTPKSDWKMGDVRGVLEVVIPVETGLAAGTTSAWQASAMIGAFLLLGIMLAIRMADRMAFRPIEQMSYAASHIAEGDIMQEIEHQSDDEIGVLAEAFRGVEAYMSDIATAVDGLSKNDETTSITPRSDRDVLSKSIVQMTHTLEGLRQETDRLVAATRAGDLSVRGDVAKFQGVYGELIASMNQTLDSVVKPINETAAALDRVAERDLIVRVEGKYSGDFAKIQQAFNRAVTNLDENLSQILLGTDQVSTASREISQGSQQLAQSTSEQAGSVQKVSASVEDMLDMTTQTAENAKQAGTIVDGTQVSAEKGVGSMERLSTSIDAIKAASDETAKVVKTIDDIAFQTNLLALNAAVEAARAGDAGKGFAVVAEEVRNLAMRSAEAAKNTANLIDGARQKAESGFETNKEVIANFEEINGQIAKLSTVMGEISVASEQQRKGASRVTDEIKNIDQGTQQNAANSEQSAAAAEELSGQAAEIRSLITTYTLSASTGAHHTEAATPASQHPSNVRVPVTVGSAAPARGKNGTNGNGNGASASAVLIPFGESVDDGDDFFKGF